MATEVFGYDLDDLKKYYGIVSIAHEDPVAYVRIQEVYLPKGCSPESTPVLLGLRVNQPRPEIYVMPGIRLPDGKEPRSISIVTILGESWMQYSYQLPYDRQVHSLDQFVEGSVRRFAKN
jgi:hypothetical protein